MSDKIMITGSRGFIGSALTKYFDNPIEYDIALFHFSWIKLNQI